MLPIQTPPHQSRRYMSIVLKDIMSAQKWSFREFATATKISLARVQRLLKNEASPTVDDLVRIYECTGVNVLKEFSIEEAGKHLRAQKQREHDANRAQFTKPVEFEDPEDTAIMRKNISSSNESDFNRHMRETSLLTRTPTPFNIKDFI